MMFIQPFCPASPSTAVLYVTLNPVAALIQLVDSTTVLILLSITFMCFTVYSIVTDISDIIATSSKAVESQDHTKDSQVANNLEYEDSLVANTVAYKDLEDQEGQTAPLSLKRRLELENDKVARKISKLLIKNDFAFASVFQDFLPKGFCFGSDFKFPEPEKATELKDVAELEVKQTTKSPFEWYLRWTLPKEELEKLTYAEKARRYYHLTTFGEPAEVEAINDTVNQDVIIPSKPKQKQKNNYRVIPMNLSLVLANQANLSDILQIQMQILKMNSKFICSFLKTLKLKFIKGHLNNFDPLKGLKYYRKPIIMITRNYLLPKAQGNGALKQISMPQHDIYFSSIGTRRSRKSSVIEEIIPYDPENISL